MAAANREAPYGRRARRMWEVEWPVSVDQVLPSGRGIPAGGVAPPSNTPGILGRRALPSGRRAPESSTRSTETGHL